MVWDNNDVKQWFVLSLMFLISEVSITECRSTRGIDCIQSNNVCSLPYAKSLRFFVIGDWGGQVKAPYVTSIQEEAANSLYKASTVLRPQFYLSTGDNFYDHGVQSVNDSRFDTTFENVYTYGKKWQMPWYLTAGNHDHYGNIQAQLDYAEVNPRWVYPSLSYPIRYAFGKKGHRTRVDIFVIDTIVICGAISEGVHNNKTRSAQPEGPKNSTSADETLKWLEDELSYSNASFIFVMGHYPVHSAGRHGDTECLKSKLSDMLIKYKVGAFISGHEHQLQHSQVTGSNGWTVHHVISGAAAKIDDPLHQTVAKIPSSATNMFVFPKVEDSPGKGGYVYVDVKKKFAAFEFFSSDGAFLYDFKLISRKMLKRKSSSRRG